MAVIASTHKRCNRTPGRNTDRDARRCRGTPLAIEDSFETAKNELGLTHNETRSWHGWHRHVSLVMLAFAMLAVIRHHANQPTPQKHRSSPGHCGPHPLVDPRDPPHSHPPGATAHSTCPHHYLVTLAKSPSSCRAASSHQTKNATVMLGGWLRGLRARAHVNTVVVALAAKLARIICAVLRSGQQFETQGASVS
jgi:hypothetical protein